MCCQYKTGYLQKNTYEKMVAKKKIINLQEIICTYIPIYSNKFTYTHRKMALNFIDHLIIIIYSKMLLMTILMHI